MSANPWAVFAHTPVEELTSQGFIWERNEKRDRALDKCRDQPSWLSGKWRQGPRKGHTSKEYARAYKARQREKWLALGLVKPKNAAEAAIYGRAA